MSYAAIIATKSSFRCFNLTLKFCFQICIRHTAFVSFLEVLCGLWSVAPISASFINVNSFRQRRTFITLNPFDLTVGFHIFCSYFLSTFFIFASKPFYDEFVFDDTYIFQRIVYFNWIFSLAFRNNNLSFCVRQTFMMRNKTKTCRS